MENISIETLKENVKENYTLLYSNLPSPAIKRIKNFNSEISSSLTSEDRKKQILELVKTSLDELSESINKRLNNESVIIGRKINDKNIPYYEIQRLLLVYNEYELMLKKLKQATPEQIEEDPAKVLKAKEVLILFHKLGIVNFLLKKQTNDRNVKKVADILSKLYPFEVKSRTLCTYLSPMIKENNKNDAIVNQNNPYYVEENQNYAQSIIDKLELKDLSKEFK